MKRLLGNSWQRIGLQVGLLAGIGLAFAIGTHEAPAEAGGGNECPSENDCTFKKPNIAIVMDYSTSMNEDWDGQSTRWEVTSAAITAVTQPGSFLSQNTNLALMRFGHDPSPGQPGTSIANEDSGLIDGNVIDVAWDDDADEYYPCNGAAIGEALVAAGAPMEGNLFGIGTWTKGALDAMSVEIAQTKADHPGDVGARAYVNVVVTDGAWTGVNGTTTLAPAGENPAITAADLFDNQNIQTYVVAVAGDPAAEMAADETAAAGGTNAALDGDTPEELEAALAGVVQDIIDSVVAPECVGGLPRVMVLLDASSSMLNINGGVVAGGMGETGWDAARAALAADMGSLFAIDVGVGDAEDVVHIGLAVFGHNAPAPGEQKLVVDYGPCNRDNIKWALDPNTSCEMPGCDDPWSGPPIAWTFQDGTIDPPGFDHATNSAMPQCSGNADFCSGSGTYTHLGLQLVKDNQADYQAAGLMNGAQYPTNPDTLYFNILITDGQYNGYSTNAQVQAELEQMFNNDITTYVIGFGDGVNTPAAQAQLTSMAEWGSGGVGDYFDADNQAELTMALSDIFTNLEFDPCCALNDCSEAPEPTTEEPDPIPSDDGDDTTDGNDDDPTADDDGNDDDPTTDTTDDMGDDDTTDDTTDDTDTGTDTGTDTASDDDVGDDGATEDETAGDTGGIDEDDGCNCSTGDSDADKTRGLLGSFFALGVMGLVRRRRRRD